MALDLELSIVGCANNASVSIVGRGQRGDDGLHLDVEVSGESLHWDPALAILAAADVLLLALPSEHEVPVGAWARTVLHDDASREMGAWVVSGEIARGADRLLYRAQLLECRVRLEAGERVARVEPYQVMTMQAGSRTVVTSAWTLGTGRGGVYVGVTTAMWEGAAAEESLRVESFGIRRDQAGQLVGCDFPTTYCTAKTNSLGCVPYMTHFGYPRYQSTDPFLLDGFDIINQSLGLLFYSVAGGTPTPFEGGTLCVTPPPIRCPGISTGGSSGNPDCTGALSFDFNAWILGGNDPALLPGVTVWTQYYYRDTLDPYGSGLTDGTQFEICH